MRKWALAVLLASCASVPGRFFPPGELDPDPDLERFSTQWYDKHLAALREPPLASVRPAHVVRLLVLPTWGHPRSYRVIIDRGGGGVLVVRRASGMGGYEPGRLDRARRVVLSRRQVARLLVLIEQIDFWAIGPRLESAGSFDGTAMVLEVRREGRYHVVHNSDPPELEAIGRLLWRYSRLRR